jgi:heptosyltransferase-2
LQKFLVIQTSFIGDVILATAVAEKIHQYFPDGHIDFLVRKGNEGLFENHPFIHKVIAWDKKKRKLFNLLHVIRAIRAQQYDRVINLHRFLSSGLMTVFSGAVEKIGYIKNPLSVLFTKKYAHEIGNGMHEVQRNQVLISSFTDSTAAKPKLYPSQNDEHVVQAEIANASLFKKVYCIAPSSVWFTKQFPKEKWIELINGLSEESVIFLLGASADFELNESIKTSAAHQNIMNVAGKFSLLQTVVLMSKATMNFVNDSAPLHLASAVNAPVAAVFCSTIPAFGFGPLSDQSFIIQTKINLDCRPCGLHGFHKCPLEHFNCAWTIDINDLLNVG